MGHCPGPEQTENQIYLAANNKRFGIFFKTSPPLEELTFP